MIPQTIAYFNIKYMLMNPRGKLIKKDEAVQVMAQ